MDFFCLENYMKQKEPKKKTKESIPIPKIYDTNSKAVQSKCLRNRWDTIGKTTSWLEDDEEEEEEEDDDTNDNEENEEDEDTLIEDDNDEDDSGGGVDNVDDK